MTFGLGLNLKTIAIAIAIALLAGGTIGARVQKKIDNADYYRAVANAKDATIKVLHAQIAARDAAAKADTAKAVNDALERKALEDKGHEVEQQSSDRVCFDAAATLRLRELWQSRSVGKGRPAAGAR